MSFGESLRSLAGDSHALVGFVIAAVLVLVLTPLVGRLAPQIGGLDDKADRPRVHRGAIPRIGGLAIVTGILVPMAVFVDLDGPYAGIFIGTLLDVSLQRFDLPGVNLDLGWAAAPVTIVWIVLLANLVNLIDGMDSLAAGIVAIAAGSVAVLSPSFGRTDAAVLSV